MSGRPYARNPRAPCADMRDVEAILPHTFRILAPVRGKDAKDEGLRRAIRRRCMEKNWRKVISIRHLRATNEKSAATSGRETRPSEEKQSSPQPQDAKEQHDVVDAAKKELDRLERKLQELLDQKHVQFQLLKSILMDEARSKTVGGGGAVPAPAAKKRRVEFKDPSTTTPQPTCTAPLPIPSTEKATEKT